MPLEHLHGCCSFKHHRYLQGLISAVDLVPLASWGHDLQREPWSSHSDVHNQKKEGLLGPGWGLNMLKLLHMDERISFLHLCLPAGANLTAAWSCWCRKTLALSVSRMCLCVSGSPKWIMQKVLLCTQLSTLMVAAAGAHISLWGSGVNKCFCR